MGKLFELVVETKKKFFPVPLSMIGKYRIDGDKVIFSYKGKEVRLSLPQKSDIRMVLGDFDEIFNKGEYKNAKVTGKTVLDIGSGIGDTAVFFSMSGARFVRGYEPDKRRFDFATANIKLNGVRNAEILNKGCPPLSEVVRELKINGNAVLKSDCEGCEYDIILRASSEDLAKFDEVILEYHHGYQKLKEKLEGAGFKVDYTGPHKKDDLEFGIMHGVMPGR